jgi:hypothetical protein
MENCNNCNKVFGKRGLKIHKRTCDIYYQKLAYEKENQEKKEYELKKIRSTDNYLPDDIIRIIYEYLMILNDKHISLLSVYRDICNLSYVSKKFFINIPSLSILKNNVYTEMNESICRKWSYDIYGLNEEDLALLNYNIVKKYNSYKIHLFNLVEIKNAAYKKYGSEYDYKVFLFNKMRIKHLNKKEKELIYEDRKVKYDHLFDKYGLKESDIYYRYYYFVKKNFPTLETIEKYIKKIKESLSIA